MSKQYITTEAKVNQLFALIGEMKCKAKVSDAIFTFIRTQFFVAEIPAPSANKEQLESLPVTKETPN